MATVGVLGGTGPAGRGIAIRLASAGYDVILGSRDEARAQVVANELLLRGEGVVRGATNAVAADCAIVIVATPWDSAVATASALRGALADKIVISMVNALVRDGKELIPLTPPRGSMAAQLAFALPESIVVGAFHHLPAGAMQDLDSGLDADVMVFSDDAGAREQVAMMVDAMPGLRAVIAGSLSLGGVVEAFTAVCASVNVRYKAHTYVKLAGLTP